MTQQAKNLASICIGKPVWFHFDNNTMRFSIGNLSEPEASEHYRQFFQNMQEKTITEQQTPVRGHALDDYIAGIVFENLCVVREKAQARRPVKPAEGTISIIA